MLWLHCASSTSLPVHSLFFVQLIVAVACLLCGQERLAWLWNLCPSYHFTTSMLPKLSLHNIHAAQGFTLQHPCCGSSMAGCGPAAGEASAIAVLPSQAALPTPHNRASDEVGRLAEWKKGQDHVGCFKQVVCKLILLLPTSSTAF